jgi:beta-galactosidase GanA
MNSFSLFCLLLTFLVGCTVSIASTRSLLGRAGVESNTVTFDGRSFSIDGKRILFIAGAVHYPRLPQSEWGTVFQLLKESGINLIQTYVFWDVHEPKQGEYSFPNDKSPYNLVKFVQVAQSYGLYVNLRIGPYVCAEWNYGGMPVWLKSLKQGNDSAKTIVFRSDDEQWLHAMLSFSDKVIDVMNENGLFYEGNGVGGPIVMLQLENEYGNVQVCRYFFLSVPCLFSFLPLLMTSFRLPMELLVSDM